ncbi:MAG: hypothetical protein C5S52_02985 [ANME-2 cluster archaeon]|nr:hypothetical protein [ANME-2 cluster archaeon]
MVGLVHITDDHIHLFATGLRILCVTCPCTCHRHQHQQYHYDSYYFLHSVLPPYFDCNVCIDQSVLDTIKTLSHKNSKRFTITMRIDMPNSQQTYVHQEILPRSEPIRKAPSRYAQIAGSLLNCLLSRSTLSTTREMKIHRSHEDTGSKGCLQAL